MRKQLAWVFRWIWIVCFAWVNGIVGYLVADEVVAAEVPGPSFEAAQDREDLNEMLQLLEVVPGPVVGRGEQIHLVPGKMQHLRFELQPLEKELAEAGGKTRPDFGILTIAVPNGFNPNTPNSHSLKILFTSVTGDIYAPNAYSARNYFKATRETDWIVVTVDGNVWPKRDSIQWRISFMAAAMRYLNEVMPEFASAKFAFGGYSGGSKLSVYLALFSAKLGKVPIGLFLGGCNEAPIEQAVQLCGVSSELLHKVTVVMSVGEKDRIAKPKQSRKVARMLEQDGFESVTILTHEAGHRLVKEHIVQMLALMENGIMQKEKE